MPRKTSDVWKHFIMDDGKYALCRHCNLAMKYSGNTTNLSDHLKRKHESTLLKIAGKNESTPTSRASSSTEENRQQQNISHKDQSSSSSTSAVPNVPMLSEFIESEPVTGSSTSSAEISRKRMKTMPINVAFDSITSFEDGGKKYMEITDSIIYMIVKDALPFSLVESEGFKYFLRTVQPLYKAPSRQTFTRLLDKKYDRLSSSIKNTFNEFSGPGFIFTTDIWTETQTTISYIGITVHFLDNKYELKSMTLGVFRLFECHTSKYIEENISNICLKWKINMSKVIMVITDNASNIVKAVTDLFGKEKHLPCFAHTVNLIPTKSIDLSQESVKSTIKKIKDIVTFSKHSVSASDELRRIQISQGKLESTTLKLIQEVPTRWNSMFHMIERFIILSESISSMLLKFPQSPPMLSAYELEIAKQLAKLLKPLEHVTEELCGISYVTSSNVIPIINCMTKCLSNFNPTIEPVIELKCIILKQVDKRFKNLELVKPLAIATILDPRYKKIHFNSPIALNSALQLISHKINTNRKENESSNNLETNLESLSETVEENLWSYHDYLSATTEAAASTSTENKDELNTEIKHYLQQPIINRAENPLLFWKNVGCMYPKLSEIAMYYLPIVASSVPSERLFSEAGQYITQTRNRLAPERLSKLLFLGSLSLEQWRGNFEANP